MPLVQSTINERSVLLEEQRAVRKRTVVVCQRTKMAIQTGSPFQKTVLPSECEPDPGEKAKAVATHLDGIPGATGLVIVGPAPGTRGKAQGRVHVENIVGTEIKRQFLSEMPTAIDVRRHPRRVDILVAHRCTGCIGGHICIQIAPFKGWREIAGCTISITVKFHFTKNGQPGSQ